MGQILARSLAKLGHHVSMASSRGPECLTSLAAEGDNETGVAPTIFAASLLEKGVPRGTKGRIALTVAGDPLDARAAVLRLVDDLGFDPVDAGNLDNSWRQQTGTPDYCTDLEVAAVKRALAEAERSRIGEYRAEEEARIRRLIEAEAASRSAHP